jgi:hypothetical protein
MKLTKGNDLNFRSTSDIGNLKFGETCSNISETLQFLKPISANINHLDSHHYDLLRKYDPPMQEFFRNLDDLNRIFLINLALKNDLFNILEENKNCSVKCLQKKLNMKESTLDCFINFVDQLYSFGFLERSGKETDAIYSNSDYTKRYFLNSSVENYSRIYYNLYKCIKRFDIVENKMREGNTLNYSNDIYNNDLDREAYYNYFYKANDLNFEYLIKEVDFSQLKQICDLHGGRGILADRLKKSAPYCDVISFENNRMKDFIDTNLKTERSGLRFVFGDLMKDKLPACDCFILPQLLIHFNKENKTSILKNCYSCLNSSGKIVIIENLLDDEREKDSCGQKMNFFYGMMGYEGLACTFNCYKDLLTICGFKFIERKQSTNGLCDIIIAKKAPSQ